MYSNRQKNLEEGGNGHESAKVLLSEWREGCGLGKQRFYEAKTTLVKLGLVEIQGSIVKVTGNGPVTVGNERYPVEKVTSRNGGSVRPPVPLPTRRYDLPDDEGENYEDF